VSPVTPSRLRPVQPSHPYRASRVSPHIAAAIDPCLSLRLARHTSCLLGERGPLLHPRATQDAIQQCAAPSCPLSICADTSSRIRGEPYLALTFYGSNLAT